MRKDKLSNQLARLRAAGEGAPLSREQAANNEVGSLQPVRELALLAHEHGAAFHTDAAQAAGKVPLNVRELGVDFLSLSGHKMYGPKGVGALFVRGGASKRKLVPLAFGGGQEWSVRNGTLNVPGIVGLGAASEVAGTELSRDAVQIAALRDMFEQELTTQLPDVLVNGASTQRLPGVSSVTVRGVEADALIINLPELCISTGAACSTGSVEPSHVLTAMGLPREDAFASIRVSFGRQTTRAEVTSAVGHIGRSARALRQQFSLSH